MTPNAQNTLRELAGDFLLRFPILDNSIASLFFSLFGARTNSVEIFYGNLSLQSRLDCIQAFCDQDAFPFDEEEQEAIKSILVGTKELQKFRNLLAHHIVLDTDILVRDRNQPRAAPESNPEKLFVWKTNKKGKYEIKPITKKEMRVASENIIVISANISSFCMQIRARYGLRP